MGGSTRLMTLEQMNLMAWMRSPSSTKSKQLSGPRGMEESHEKSLRTVDSRSPCGRVRFGPRLRRMLVPARRIDQFNLAFGRNSKCTTKQPTRHFWRTDQGCE